MVASEISNYKDYKVLPKCEKHRCNMEFTEQAITGRRLCFCPMCADEEEKLKSKTSCDIETKKAQHEINTALDNAMLAPRFRTKTLQNYITSTENQLLALNAALWFVENWRDSAGMILIGNTGTGKNHLAAGIVKDLVKQKATALCTEPVKLVRAVKESWRQQSEKNESDVLKMFVKPDVLVIDEIGVQFGSDTERMYLTEIINDRYNAIKPTILTGNLTLQELTGIVGNRAIDRLRDNGKLVVFDWQSYRGKK